MTLILDKTTSKKVLSLDNKFIYNNFSVKDQEKNVFPIPIVKQHDVFVPFDKWYEMNKDVIERLIQDFVENLDQECIPEYEIVYFERQIERQICSLFYEYSSSARRSYVKQYETD